MSAPGGEELGVQGDVPANTMSKQALKICLLTGGSTGIGFSFAGKLLARGMSYCKVSFRYVLSRDQEGLPKTLVPCRIRGQAGPKSAVSSGPGRKCVAVHLLSQEITRMEAKILVSYCQHRRGRFRGFRRVLSLTSKVS